MKIEILNQKYYSDIKANLLALSAIVMFAIFSLFGGAEPRLNFNIGLMFIFGIFLIFNLTTNSAIVTFFKLPVYVRLVIVAPIILPLLQLIPLPSEVWPHLSGQRLRLDVLRLVGANESWQPLSLTPAATAYTAVMGIFFSAFLLACISISDRQFSFVVLAAVIVAVLGVVIGAFQFSGAFPALNFYEYAHTNVVAGFFANKNHMALILAATLILSRWFVDKTKLKVSPLMFVFYTVFLVVAVLATNSRAGIALMFIAIFLTFSSTLKGSSKKLLFIAILIIASGFYAVSYSSTFNLVYERFSDVSDDGRWTFLVNSIPLVSEFYIFGSGYGSFSSIYINRESIEALSPVYTNQLHNDYLQLVIEGGLLGVLALALVGYSVFRAWRVGKQNNSLRNLAWMGLSVLVLFGVHSIVDYPLRRPAALVYFCIGLACTFRVLLPTVESPAKRMRATQTA